MAQALTFYMDESGFTGEYLMSREQPVFAHVSTILSDQRCQDLYREFFKGTQALELKHQVLARRPAGRERVAKFIESINQDDQANFTSWLVHKEFTLLTYLVDCWVESAAHVDGVDLYKDGANLGMCNMAYYCLRTFEGEEFLRAHLVRFQKMMMKRTLAAYRDFWRHMYADYERADQRTKDILSFFVYSERRLGFPHLLHLPKRAVDPGLPGAVATCGHWRNQTEQPLNLVHDNSSSLAKDKKLWSEITSPEFDEMTLGIPGRETKYPLNVQQTVFADSRNHLQLQFCDLLAGASVAWARRFTGPSHDQEYFDRLDAAGIENFKIGAIWPESEVHPDALGMKGWSGELTDAITDQLVKLSEKAKHSGGANGKLD